MEGGWGGRGKGGVGNEMTSLSTLQHVRRAMKRNVRVITTMMMMMMMMMIIIIIIIIRRRRRRRTVSALSTISYKGLYPG